MQLLRISIEMLLMKINALADIKQELIIAIALVILTRIYLIIAFMKLPEFRLKKFNN